MDVSGAYVEDFNLWAGQLFSTLISLALITIVCVVFTGLACVVVTIVSFSVGVSSLTSGVLIVVGIVSLLPVFFVVSVVGLAIFALVCSVVSCLVGLFVAVCMLTAAYTGTVATAGVGWGWMLGCFQPLPWVAGRVFSAMGVCAAVAAAAMVSIVLLWIWVGRRMFTWVRWGVRGCVGGFLGAVARV